MSDDRYDVITWRGHKFDKYTVAAIEAAEELLDHKLEVMQGSYNGGKDKVAASSGTHDGGGAVDLGVTTQVVRDIRVLRSIGFAAWHRTPDQGPWGHHIHAILIGNEAASAGAKRQVAAYRDYRDGLAGNHADPTWHPKPIPTFEYPEEDMTPEQFVDLLNNPRVKEALAAAVWSEKFDNAFEGEKEPRLVKSAIAATYLDTKEA